VLIYDSTNTSAGRLVGNGLIATTGNSQNFNVTPAKKLTVQADVSWFRPGWMGSHEFQTGVFIQPLLRLRSEANYLNGGFILEEVRLRVPGDPSSDYIPFHRQFVDPSQLVIATAKSNSQNYAAYVQDSWKPVPRLTLVAGIRFDRVVADDELFDVRTQSSLEIGPRAGAIYAPDGRQQEYRPRELQPHRRQAGTVVSAVLGGERHRDDYRHLRHPRRRELCDRVGDARPDPSGGQPAHRSGPASGVH